MYSVLHKHEHEPSVASVLTTKLHQIFIIFFGYFSISNMSLLIRGPFQWWTFTRTSHLIKKLFCYNSITSRQIAANIYTYRHSAAVFSCGKFRSNNYRQFSNIRCTLVGNKNCRSLRCSWSIACRRCSNYIFILDLTPGFIGWQKTTVRRDDKHLSLAIWCVLY